MNLCDNYGDSKMGRTYKTAQGRTVDFEQIRLTNELTPAIGNMRVNARGDQLGPGGNIVKTREQMLDEHYKTNVSKRKQVEPDVIPTKGGKAKAVDNTPPPRVEINVPEIPQEKPIEDDFVDPEEVVTTREEIPNTANTTQSTKVEVVETPTATRGEKVLKGGLAKAVAKTKEYNDKKNKPKRI